MKLLSQPRTILLITALLVIFSGVITAGTFMDIHFHDTMYVINSLHMGILIGGYFLLQAVIYYLTRNYKQWRSIQYFHVATTILILLASMSSEGYYDFGSLYRISIITVTLILFFVLGQILFIINLIAGFIRGKKVLNPNH